MELGFLMDCTSELEEEEEEAAGVDGDSSISTSLQNGDSNNSSKHTKWYCWA